MTITNIIIREIHDQDFLVRDIHPKEGVIIIVLAVELGATAEQIAETMHIHPTLPESINSAAGGVHKPS